MIKYAVKIERFQFNPIKFKSPVDAFFAYDDHYDRLVCLCNTLEEARSELAKISVYSHVYDSRCVLSEFAFIEASDYELNDDFEWEFMSGSDYYDFKFEEI